jgi:hypothetical protein
MTEHEQASPNRDEMLHTYRLQWPIEIVVAAREAAKQSRSLPRIASQRASSGARSRDPLALNELAGIFVSRRNKKAPDDAGAFDLLMSRDQYFATTGPVQLKR